MATTGGQAEGSAPVCWFTPGLDPAGCLVQGTCSRVQPPRRQLQQGQQQLQLQSTMTLCSCDTFNQDAPRKAAHSSSGGGLPLTVWYVNEFLYSAWQLGTVCGRQRGSWGRNKVGSAGWETAALKQALRGRQRAEAVRQGGNCCATGSATPRCMSCPIRQIPCNCPWHAEQHLTPSTHIEDEADAQRLQDLVPRGVVVAAQEQEARHDFRGEGRGRLGRRRSGRSTRLHRRHLQPVPADGAGLAAVVLQHMVASGERSGGRQQRGSRRERRLQPTVSGQCDGNGMQTLAARQPPDARHDSVRRHRRAPRARASASCWQRAVPNRAQPCRRRRLRCTLAACA